MFFCYNKAVGDNMIEVELKYKLNSFPKVDFPLVEERREEDIYYDTKNYDLLRNGNFLRIRNQEKIDFKLSTNDLTHLYCRETRFPFSPFPSEKIEEVFQNLKLDISCYNYEEFKEKLIVLAPILKKRKTYKINDSITMVLDEIEDLGYFLEIEYDVEQESITEEEGKKYEDILISVLKENKLLQEENKKVSIGYVELYLKEHNIEAYHLGLYQEN